MVTDVNLIKVDRVIKVVPHVVVVLHVMIKTLQTNKGKESSIFGHCIMIHQRYLCPSLKLMIGNATDETESFLVLFNTELKKD